MGTGKTGRTDDDWWRRYPDLSIRLGSHISRLFEEHAVRVCGYESSVLEHIKHGDQRVFEIRIIVHVQTHKERNGKNRGREGGPQFGS